jgi:hypothetical protein
MKVNTVRSTRIATTIKPPALTELSGKQQVPAGYGCFRILTAEDGDKRFAWNTRSIAEISEARQFFNECVAEGLVPYKVGVGGDPSAEQMQTFDPHAGEVIFRPADALVAGG